MPKALAISERSQYWCFSRCYGPDHGSGLASAAEVGVVVISGHHQLVVPLELPLCLQDCGSEVGLLQLLEVWLGDAAANVVLGAGRGQVRSEPWERGAGLLEVHVGDSLCEVLAQHEGRLEGPPWKWSS